MLQIAQVKQRLTKPALLKVPKSPYGGRQKNALHHQDGSGYHQPKFATFP